MSSQTSKRNIDLYKVAQTALESVLAPSKTSPTGTNGGKEADNHGNNGIKVLLLDVHTAPIISLVATQSDLLKQEIYLIDRLENTERDRLRNLKCICLFKPDDQTVTNLSEEISNPKYAEYELSFTNVISKSRLERIAESDDLEVVSKVVEVFMDYYVLNKALFTVTGITNPYSLNSFQSWDEASLESAVEGLSSLLLSLRMKPIIKYESNSKLASKLANRINYEMTSNNTQLFEQLEPKPDVPPILLILDRKNDPVTPLLFPWTYQAMINELLGIGNDNNCVDLTHISNISEELRKVIMNEIQDPFFQKSMFMNFGDLSTLLKQYVDEYKLKTNTNSNISSIKDMRFFLENYPEFRKMSLNLSKHMLITSEIDKQINAQRVWETSEFEQNMCSYSDLSHHDEELAELETLLFDKPKTDGSLPKPLDDGTKLRLLALYALKYEKHPASQLSRLLKTINNSEFNSLCGKIVSYAGSKARRTQQSNVDDLSSIFNKRGKGGGNGAANHVAQLFSNISGGGSGTNNGRHTDNAYMQHEPRLYNILESVIKGKLATCTSFSGVGKSLPANVPPRDIIVFVIGGVCYEEARIVHELNKTVDGVRIVLGGTHTINSKEFISQIRENNA